MPNLTFHPMPAPAPGGNPVASLYVERFWLPVLGPTASWLLRLVWREMQPEGVYGATYAELAGALGVNTKQLHHTLGRLVTFRAMRPTATGQLQRVYQVRTRLPLITEAMEARLPDGLRAEHARMRAQLVAAVAS